MNEEPPQPQAVTKGCCQCQPYPLPAFFADTGQDRGFPDNKHHFIQVSLTALQPVKVILALELLHGSYYHKFDTELYDIGELSIFVPGRSASTPKNPSTASFQFVLEKQDFSRLVLPLNLPHKTIKYERVGVSSALSERVFENDVLLDHSVDISIGDPNYPKSYYDYLLSKAAAAAALPHNNTTILPSDAELPPRKSIPEEYENVYAHESWWTNGDSSGPNSFITVPYIPFISSCDGYGRHTSLACLLETHPKCTRVPYEQTRPIEQWTSVGGTPHADECGNIVMSPGDIGWDPTSRDKMQSRGIYLTCTYEENLKQPTSKSRWFEAGPGQRLFSITKNPVERADFDATYFVDGRGVRTRWGRNADAILGNDRLISVEVHEKEFGLKKTMPQLVRIVIEYYQVSQETKRFVRATMSLMKKCTTELPLNYGGNSDILNAMKRRNILPCEVDIEGNLKSKGYTLEVQFVPLDWWALLNAFEFQPMLYMVMFVVIGVVAVSEGIILWFGSRITTRLRHPPPFHGISLFSTISRAPVLGLVLVTIPCLLSALWIWAWFAENGPFSSPNVIDQPSRINFEGIAGSWLDTLGLDEGRVQMYRNGRIGTCLFSAMLYICVLCSSLMVPDWSNRRGGGWYRP